MSIPTWYRNRWLVICDDEAKSYVSRQEARRAARVIAGHPANANIRLFGPYANADGEARVIDLGNPNEFRARDGNAAYEYTPG